MNGQRQGDRHAQWSIIIHSKRTRLRHLQDNRFNWKIIMLSEISQIQKDKYHTFSLIQELQNERRHEHIKETLSGQRKGILSP